MSGIIDFIQQSSDVIASIAGVVTVATGFLVWLKKVVNKKLDSNFNEISKKFDIFTEKVTTDISDIKQTNDSQMEKINQLLDHQEQLGLTDKHVLRALITGKYYEYFAKNYLPVHERECISLLYEDYKALHGNTFIDGLYEKMMELPDSPE